MKKGHNYTILITGSFTALDEPVERKNLATFAFADNDKRRIGQLIGICESDQSVALDCPSCTMRGRLEFHDRNDDVALFHFILDELIPRIDTG